jgi:hypothetical protein
MPTCVGCNALCLSNGYNNFECVDKSSLTLGINTALFYTMLVIQIIALALLVWFSIYVMNKCNGNPKWLNPVIITLLILYLLLGWFPFIGILLFIPLIVILLVYNNRCNKK